jgi:CRP-like cAMP-binding protein
MANCEQCIAREFSSLKALNKDELLELAYCKTSHTIQKGEVIFEEGESMNGIYCIKQGVCKLTKLSPNGKSHIVKLVSKGELLGQSSLISEEPVNLSAVALEEMEVCYIPKTEVLGFFDKNNHFSMNVMKTICGDLKESQACMVDMTQKSVKERLAVTLLYLYYTFGTNEDNSLKVQLSRDELATMIGTATENCIRLLFDFKKIGIIELAGKKITLKDIGKLKTVAK